MFWKGPHIVQRVLRNNIVFLKSMDEEEFLLVNAHKFKPYLVQEDRQSEEPITQEDIRGGDCQVN